MDIIEIPIALIDEDTDQPRYQFDEEALQELMKSIEEIGLLSPIKVRTTANNRYKIIYGNRRYKASKMLGKPTMSCIVSTVTDEMEIYLEQIAENLTREGFSPIEEAEAFHKLMNDAKFSSSIKYLSSKLGKPESYIKNKCDLLKFGNSVKKLIVSGTEIRKDKLTEDQLLPIKDLAIEHRDPLALIIARDEMPVSDVKKIAKMFKDKEISESTKGKLLYKSGNELVETWSVFQNNRAERAKPAPAKAPTKVQKAEKASTAIDTPLAEHNGLSLPSSPSQQDETATITTMAMAPIQIKLQQLLSVVQAPSTSDLQSEASKLDDSDKDKFLSDVSTLVEHLEKQLDEWKKVRELALSK
ncbi:ParB/RepB/Spo0J family partition protein [Paenibacillus sp. 5J-6]|uniref:ParB/RepB/Spo0J family partition protein n=1 Tax=Paenibacillus silvestris TaxID=2606219 RepID=A0A6L8UZM7_9BACL|nr:ParB/RepB/Spo0J family partition protein [Paenibacillus silvestris]MZQ83495.1 ParB/RepB/Spo0J family partition protein [Paenibacillus silvestris]